MTGRSRNKARLGVGRVAIVMLGLLSLAGCAQDDPGGGRCSASGFGDIPILNRHGSPIIRANINGHPIALVVDSGTFVSLISSSAADGLGLVAVGGTGTIGGVGGAAFVSVQKARTLGLGTGRATDFAFAVADLPFHGAISGLPIVGLFGADFLLNYDLILDQPDATMSLVRIAHCTSLTPLWSGKTHAVPIRIDSPAKSKIGVTLVLNGKRVDAALDSGAAWTVIPLDDAHRAGVTRDMLEQDVKIHARGVGNIPIDGWRHRFASLAVGDIVLRNVVLTVLPDQGFALLGDDFLRGHRIWIPRNGDMMYVQGHDEIPADDPARRALQPG